MHKIYSQLHGFKKMLFFTNSYIDFGGVFCLNFFNGEINTLEIFGDGHGYGTHEGNGFSSYGHFDGDYKILERNIEEIPSLHFYLEHE